MASLDELKEYIAVLYYCRELASSLPVNVPEKLDAFIKDWSTDVDNNGQQIIYTNFHA